MALKGSTGVQALNTSNSLYSRMTLKMHMFQRTPIAIVEGQDGVIMRQTALIFIMVFGLVSIAQATPKRHAMIVAGEGLNVLKGLGESETEHRSIDEPKDGKVGPAALFGKELFQQGWKVQPFIGSDEVRMTDVAQA